MTYIQVYIIIFSLLSYNTVSPIFFTTNVKKSEPITSGIDIATFEQNTAPIQAFIASPTIEENQTNMYTVSPKIDFSTPFQATTKNSLSPLLDTTSSQQETRTLEINTEAKPSVISSTGGPLIPAAHTTSHEQTSHNGAYKKITHSLNHALFDFTKMIIKKKLNLLSPEKHKTQSWSAIVADMIKEYILKISKLSAVIKAMQSSQESSPQNTALNNLKIELQTIAQQLENFNNQNVYPDPNIMMQLLQTVTQFLQQIDAEHISSATAQKMNTIFQQASICFNLCINQNIIFSIISMPQDVINFFNQSFINTEKLSTMDSVDNVLQIVYNQNGYMDQLLQTWQQFQTSPLYSITSDRQYAAFATFLLIFENSIITTSIVIDQVGSYLQAINPVHLKVDFGV